MILRIYKITNKVNNKAYIGQTRRSLQRRFNQHCHPNSACIKLSRAIAKYGRENFMIEELFTSTDQEVTDMQEKELITKYKTQTIGYNIHKGGRGNAVFKSRKGSVSSFKGKTHTEETKAKMRGIHKGKRRNTATEFKKGHKTYNKGLKIGWSPMQKKVVDIVNGYIWDSAKEAATVYGFNVRTLRRWLRGDVVNNTNLRYVEDV